MSDVFCRSCGNRIKKETEICPKCGVRQLPEKSVSKVIDENVSEKSRLAAFLFSFFLGGLGIHRFYVGKITSGIMQILFGWATLFIWNFVDMIMILAGSFKDSEGKKITNWDM